MQASSQFQDLGGTNGSVNMFEIKAKSISNNQNVVFENEAYGGEVERTMLPMKQSDRPLTSQYVQSIQNPLGSEYGGRPPTSSIQRTTSRPGSQSQAILSQMGAAHISSSNNQTISNGQPTLESEYRSGHHQSAAEYAANRVMVNPQHHQTSPRGQSSGQGVFFKQDQQLQRDNLQQREQDLEERYRQLQGYSQSQLGVGAEQKDSQVVFIGAKQVAESENNNPERRYSHMQYASHQTSQEPAWNPKKAWARPASASMSQTERPQQPAQHEQQQKPSSYIGDDISCSQNTHTVRLNHIINGKKANYAQSEHGKFGQMTASTRQPQLDNQQPGSQSQTEAENPEPGINYDKNYLTGEVGPYPLHMPSGSIGCSQSQQSPGKQQLNQNQVDESVRDALNDESESQTNNVEQQQHQMNEDSMMQYYENENHMRKVSIGQRESEKMQTGSFQARDVSEQPIQVGGVPDLNNVTAMLQRAMHYNVDAQDDQHQIAVESLKMKVQDSGRNDKQYGIGTKETYLSKTTEITRIGHSFSNSCILEKPGADASTISVNNQESRRDIQVAQNHNCGEEKLQLELERIQQQKQILSSYLPKDRQCNSPDKQNQGANIHQVQLVDTNQRDHSNSSFGRIYGNNELNFSSKFGKNLRDQYSYSKSPAQDTNQNPQGQIGVLNTRTMMEQVPSQSNLNSGPDAPTSSKDNQKSSYQIHNTTSYGQFTSSSQFGMRAGEQDIPREVFNYRDLSQDASKRSRLQVVGTDRPITYPTNMTNITHGDCVSPSSSNQVQRRDQPQSSQLMQQMNIGLSSKGISWRIEKSDHVQAPQPYQINGTSDRAFTSQERYPLNSKGDMYQPQEIAARSKSRDVFGARVVDSPSVKRRQGMSPLSQSSRAKELQNSGLALLKKTTALLKNPPAVSNYKALNFEMNDVERAPAVSELKNQFNDSAKAFDSNANRKGVILSLYRKNSVTGSVNEKDSDHQRKMQNQSYRAVVGRSIERKQYPFGQSSIYTKNSAEVRTSSNNLNERNLDSRISSKFESANTKKAILPKNYDQDRETGSTRIGLKKSESENRIGSMSHGDFRGQGKLTLGFLRQLKGNNANEKTLNKRSVSDIQSDKRRSSNGSIDLKNSKDNEKQNMSMANRASSFKGDSDAGCHTSTRTFADANQSSHNASRSVTSKINRYKKFERELEQQKAQLEAIEKRNQEREALKAKQLLEQMEKDRANQIKQQSSIDNLKNQVNISISEKELSNKLSREEEIKKLYEIESRKVISNKQSEKKLGESLTHQDSKAVQKSSVEYGTIPEMGSINQRTVSPNRTFDSHRGSNFTLGNKIQASGEPSPTDQALKAQKSWNDEIRPIDQKSSSNKKDVESLSKSHGLPSRKNQYSGSFAVQSKPTSNNKSTADLPGLHFNYQNVQRAAIHGSTYQEYDRKNAFTSDGQFRDGGYPRDQRKSPNVSYIQTNYIEDDSLARADKVEMHDKLPTQIHDDQMLSNVVGSHLADNVSPRDHYFRNHNITQKDFQRVQPKQSENEQRYQYFNQLQDNKYRSKSYTIYQRQGETQQNVPQNGASPLNQSSQVAEYISKNERLRQRQYQLDTEKVSNTQISPMPTEGTIVGQNLQRTLSPLHGSGTGPQGTSPYSQFSSKQLQPDLIPMRGPSSKQVEEWRSRYGQPEVPAELSDSHHNLQNTHSSDLYNNMKSNFAKKIRDRSFEKASSNEGTGPQIQVYRNIQRKEYVEQRDPLSFGRAIDQVNHGESSRQQSVTFVNTTEQQESSLHHYHQANGNDHVQRSKSTEQPNNKRSRADGLKQPTETGTSSYLSYVQTHKEQANNHQSSHITTSTGQHDFRNINQPHFANQNNHQNTQSFFSPNGGFHLNQFQYTNKSATQSSINQQSNYVQNGHQAQHYSQELGSSVETPVLPGPRKNGRSDEESRVSTLKMVTAKQQQLYQHQNFAQTQQVHHSSNAVSRDESRVTLSSNHCHENQGQNMDGYFNPQFNQVPSNQDSQYGNEDAYVHMTGNATRTIPSGPNKNTDFINTEQQTIGSIIRSPEIEVTSKDLAMEQLQTATLSKNIEPSMAQTKSSYRQKQQEANENLQTGETQSEQGDIRKLIKLQFEQARMLMDLQKQLMQCQEFEKAAHHLDSMNQSISRNFQEDITSSSQKHSTSVREENFNGNIPIDVASSVAALMQRGSASTRPRQRAIDDQLNQEIDLSQQNLPDLVHDQVNINYDMVMEGQDGYQFSQQDVSKKGKTDSQNPHQVSQQTHSHTYSKRSIEKQSHLKKPKQVRVKKNKPSNEIPEQIQSKQDATNTGTSPSKHSKQSSHALLKSSNSQTVTNMEQPTPHQALSQHPRANRSHMAKGSTALSHASSIAIPQHNINAINSNRSIHSVVSKQSQQIQMSQISHQKASTLNLIQKIYKQMEKIDEQISHKERVDEQRYREMERKMKKLWKRYTKVKNENDHLNQQSSQLLSLQPSQRFQVRSLGIDAGASSCDFEQTNKNESKLQSTKHGKKQEKKSRHRSKGDLGKESIMSDFQKPFSTSIDNHTVNQTYKSSKRQGAKKQNLEAESERSAIQIVEHESRQYQQNQNKSECRNLNSNSGLSHAMIDQAISRDGLNAASKLNQVNDLLQDEPLHARVSECTSLNMNNVCDQTQQFPSEKRSNRDTDMSATSEAPLKQQSQQSRFGENPSFGAQYPSVHESNGKEPIVLKKGAVVDSGLDQGQSRVSSLSTSGLYTKINNQIMDATSLQINSLQSQYSNAVTPQQQPSAHPPPTSKSHANRKTSKEQRHHTSGNEIPSVSSRTQNNQRVGQNIGVLGTTNSLMKSHVLENLTEAEMPATESTGNKDSRLKLGSSSGLPLAEETLQIQQFQHDEQQHPDVAVNPSSGQLKHQKEDANHQKELENQIQFMNGAITQLKEGYQSQIEAMKQFYQEQINQLKQEVNKKERSQSRGRAAQSSGMGTPAAALQNRMKSLSNENILNLTNLSMSASEKKNGNNQQHQQMVSAPNKDASPTKASPIVSPIMHSNPQPLRMSPKVYEGKSAAAVQQSQSMTNSVQASLRNPTPSAPPADLLPGLPAGIEGHAAIAKLMDLRKFYETIEQLNEAVSQKEKLEEKLQKIKEKVSQAKSIRAQHQNRSGGSRERNSKRPVDIPKPVVDSYTADDSCSLQILSREAEVLTNSERTRDYEESGHKGRKDGWDRQRHESNNKPVMMQNQSMYIEDEMAALSGITLSDLPARDGHEEVNAPIQTSSGRHHNRLVTNQQFSGSQLGYYNQQQLQGTVERQKNDSMVLNQSNDYHQNQLTPQGLPPMSGSRSDFKNNLRNSVQRQTINDRQSTKQTADFTHAANYSSQNSIVMNQYDGNNRSNISYGSQQNSLVHDLGRNNQPLEQSFNLNCMTSQLQQSNGSGQLRNQAANLKSYESQPTGAGSNYNVEVGSVQDNSRSTDNLPAHGSQRPQVMATYQGAERFMQPFIPGSGKQTENTNASQQLHHSTALAPGLILLDQNSSSQNGVLSKDQMQTLQQQTMQDNLGMEGLSEIYLRDTTQQSVAAGASHSQQNVNSTLESSMQHLALLDQQNRRGIYQKIVGLQSMYHNQSSGSSYNPAQNYGQQILARSGEYKHAGQPVAGGAPLQPYLVNPGQGIGVGITPLTQSNTLSLSMPNTRMDTINADSSVKNHHLIMRQDQQDAQKRVLASQQVTANALQERRNTSPILLKRLEGGQAYVQGSASGLDTRSRQAHTTQQMTAPNLAYPTAAAGGTLQAVPVFLQPYQPNSQAAISLKPVSAGQMVAVPTQGVKMGYQPAYQAPGLPDNQVAAAMAYKQQFVRSPSPTLQPRIAGVKSAFGNMQPVVGHQQVQGQKVQNGQHENLQLKQQQVFNTENVNRQQNGQNASIYQNGFKSYGCEKEQVDEVAEEGEQEISYTIHSESIEGTTDYQATSHATSEITSSHPDQTERSETVTEQTDEKQQKQQQRHHGLQQQNIINGYV